MRPGSCLRSVKEERRLLAGWCCRSGRCWDLLGTLPTRPFSLTVPWPGCSLDDNGVEFPVGQIWSPGDPCELCICQVNDNLRAFSCFPLPPSPEQASPWPGPVSQASLPSRTGPPQACPLSRSHALRFHSDRKGWEPGSLPSEWQVPRCAVEGGIPAAGFP